MLMSGTHEGRVPARRSQVERMRAFPTLVQAGERGRLEKARRKWLSSVWSTHYLLSGSQDLRESKTRAHGGQRPQLSYAPF